MAKRPKNNSRPRNYQVAPFLVRLRLFNWPLLLGTWLVLLVAFLSIRGPQLAPRDPAQENTIIKVGDDWEIPPFDAFTPGFPLGSDLFGRDLLSRILTAIQPTIIMVATVAIFRLFIGGIIGLIAGWSNRWLGRLLDSVIASALSVPVFMVALGAIAVVGTDLGIWAFIIGLSVTGWVETARIVRDQTQAIRGQIYIEASHALGASTGQMLLGHVLRQIMPMIWMLFAFEISGTMMITAGLGFLGYYIGGDVWVEVDDFVSRRISGTPELGQMLATSWERLNEPWAMVAVGTVVFFTVLGFNLMGAGLRQRLNVQIGKRYGLIANLTQNLRLAIDEYILYPISKLTYKLELGAAFRHVMIVLGGVLIGGALTFWYMFAAPQTAGLPSETPSPTSVASVENTPPPVPTDVLEATSTLESGNGDENVFSAAAWSFIVAADIPPFYQPQVTEDGSIFLVDRDATMFVLSPDGEVTAEFALDPEPFNENPGGDGFAPPFIYPFVAQDGTIIVISNRLLYAMNPSGEKLWEFPFDRMPSEYIQIMGDEVYLLSKNGALYMATLQDGLQWSYEFDLNGASGVTRGLDGTLYFTLTNMTVGMVQAFSSDGVPLWRTEIDSFDFRQTPQVSPAGDLVFLDDNIFDAQTGERLIFEFPVEIDRFVIGLDGNLYLRSRHTVIQWQIGDSGFEILNTITWDHNSVYSPHIDYLPAIYISADQVVWFFYPYGGLTLIVWVNMDGEVLNMVHLQNFLIDDYPGYSWEFSGININNQEFYVCGDKPESTDVTCLGYTTSSTDPFWVQTIENMPEYDVGFIIDGRFYILSDNVLYVIDLDIPE